jgi:hypothetical protein
LEESSAYLTTAKTHKTVKKNRSTTDINLKEIYVSCKEHKEHEGKLTP